MNAENKAKTLTDQANRMRAKLSQWWYGPNVQKPTAAELEAAHHHAEHAEHGAVEDVHTFTSQKANHNNHLGVTFVEVSAIAAAVEARYPDVPVRPELLEGMIDG